MSARLFDRADEIHGRYRRGVIASDQALAELLEHYDITPSAAATILDNEYPPGRSIYQLLPAGDAR